MKNTLTILLIILLGILAYTYAAYTRPEEPAGRALHNWLNGYQPRPTLRPLQVVSPAAAGYTLPECCEIYNATTDSECHAIERDYYTPAELSEIYPTH